MKNLFYLAIILIASCTNTSTSECKFPELTGEYLGQCLPGDSSVLFAPGIISTGMADRDIAITPDGKELFFTRTIGSSGLFTIFHSKVENGKWTKPEIFEFCNDVRYQNTEPFISPDGNKFLFVSNRPVTGDEKSSYDIWVSEKDENKIWTKPYNIGEPVNSNQNEFFPTLTVDGTIYFNHFDTIQNQEFIYRSKFVDGKYSRPEKLNEKVNGGRARFNAFISPDESFIIIPTFGLPDSYGRTDYYIVFRDEQDNWSNPINMGQINSADGQEWSASLSPDGKYLFFMSARIPEDNLTITEFTYDNFYDLHNSPQNGLSDIYWIKSDFIEELRLQAKF